MNEALAEGSRAASSILHRANDAIDKEHRLEAVSELQSRVEDWKGHRIDHFGELLLYGNFTVLKGEGAKEVEREVGKIFNLLPPEVRTMFLNAVKQEQPTLDPPTSRSYKPGNIPPDILSPPERTFSHKGYPERFITSLEGLPEEISEEQRSTIPSHNIPVRTYPLSPKIQPLTQGLKKARSMGSFLYETKNDTESLLKSPQSPGVHAAHTPTSASHKSTAYSRDGFGAELGSTSPTLSRRGKLKLERAFSEVDPNLKFIGKLAKYLKSDARCPFIHHLSADLSLREIQHLKLKKLANDLGIRAPVRVQYKVYLFERILLCCKEINPNKPKNKMLGNSKPPVDKKGKPRLQLKGRIFMQNVTDVVSLGHKGLLKSNSLLK